VRGLEVVPQLRLIGLRAHTQTHAARRRRSKDRHTATRRAHRRPHVRLRTRSPCGRAGGRAGATPKGQHLAQVKAVTLDALHVVDKVRTGRMRSAVAGCAQRQTGAGTCVSGRRPWGVPKWGRARVCRAACTARVLLTSRAAGRGDEVVEACGAVLRLEHVVGLDLRMTLFSLRPIRRRRRRLRQRRQRAAHSPCRARAPRRPHRLRTTRRAAQSGAHQRIVPAPARLRR
jgi:hypothetical protein